MVNQYYVYLVDEDFGPLFVKFCSYFPYNAKVCLNGHEYVQASVGQARYRNLSTTLRHRRLGITEQAVVSQPRPAG